MTEAKAATVTAALINAGYLPSVRLDGAGAYHVTVVSEVGQVSAATVSSFATTNGVTATVQAVDFV